MDKIFFLIKKQKQQVIKDIELDDRIDADKYTNVARLKELEKLEKAIQKL